MEILKISSQNSKKIIKVAIKYLKNGKTVIFPTDTVYGIICDATNRKAVNKIFKIKKRSRRNPFPIFIKDIKTAKKISRTGKEQERFLKTAWPGKVTVILEKEKDQIFGTRPDKIALRVPKHKLVNFLLKEFKKPLIGTSANISGKETSQNSKKIIEEFKNRKEKPSLIIDAGKLPESKPSTIIDLTTSPPKILRV